MKRVEFIKRAAVIAAVFFAKILTNHNADASRGDNIVYKSPRCITTTRNTPLGPTERFYKPAGKDDTENMYRGDLVILTGDTVDDGVPVVAKATLGDIKYRSERIWCVTGIEKMNTWLCGKTGGYLYACNNSVVFKMGYEGSEAAPRKRVGLSFEYFERKGLAEWFGTHKKAFEAYNFEAGKLLWYDGKGEYAVTTCHPELLLKGKLLK